MPHCSENAVAAVAAKPELNRLVSPQSDPSVIVEHGAGLGLFRLKLGIAKFCHEHIYTGQPMEPLRCWYKRGLRRLYV